MKCFAWATSAVCISFALAQTSYAKSKPLDRGLAKKVSQSKTSRNPIALEDIKLDEPDRQTASVEVIHDQSATPKNFEKEITAAEAQDRAGFPAKGAEILRPFAEKLSRHGLITLAKLYGKSGDVSAQLRTLELGIAKNAKDYVLQSLLGDALANTPRADDAFNAYTEAKNLNKNYRPAYDGLLSLLEKKKEHYEALVLVTDMVKLFANVPRYQSVLCRLYSEGDYLAKTVESCQNAIEKDSSNAENFVHLAMSYRDQEKAKEATSVLERALKRFPASEPVHSAAGDLKALNKDYGSAYALFKKASTADPKSDRAWVGLAQASFELQKNDESMKAFANACKIDRKNTKDFRTALGKLRSRGQEDWAFRFESAMAQACE